jgi:vacuolar-type H+-ATPase subunit H
MYKRFLVASVAASLAALLSCSSQDESQAKQKLEHAKEELKHDVNEAGREIKKDAKEASREVKKGAEELKEKANSK